MSNELAVYYNIKQIVWIKIKKYFFSFLNKSSRDYKRLLFCRNR